MSCAHGLEIINDSFQCEICHVSKLLGRNLGNNPARDLDLKRCAGMPILIIFGAERV